MSPHELPGLTIVALQKLLRAREVSPREVITALHERIVAHDPEIGAYLSLDLAGALAAADEVDVSLPLGGIPLAVKDLISVRDQPLTCASKILGNHRALYDATAIVKLKAAGAIPFGKTNLDEFAMGSSTENSGFQPTRNPWDRARIPGGSSGGSAAAVAGDLAIASLGSDTGGSIRQPAALCGVVGLKPTYGVVSRYGAVAFASSLDQIGPFGRTVRDCGLLLSVIAGDDVCDSTCLGPRDAVELPVRDDLAGLRIGVLDVTGVEGVEPGVRASYEAAVATVRGLGAAEVREVELEFALTPHALAAYYLIAPAEASANLARYDGVRYGLRVEKTDTNAMYSATREVGFGEEVKRRIMLGTYALSAGYYDAYYGKALKVRRLIADDFDRAYLDADVLLTPASPSVAFPFGSKRDNPLAMYLCDVYTIPTNLAGHPGMSVPFGTGAEGLPVGMQVLAGTLGEPAMFRAAAALERAVGKGN